jgi:hypothetical protein
MVRISSVGRGGTLPFQMQVGAVQKVSDSPFFAFFIRIPVCESIQIFDIMLGSIRGTVSTLSIIFFFGGFTAASLDKNTKSEISVSSMR